MSEPVEWSGQMRILGHNQTGPTVQFGAEISTWPELKYVRGVSHIHDVMDAAAAWDAAGHVRLDLSLSEDRLTITGTMRVDASPPLEELAVKLGDAVHNLRSALDSLTWELCHLGAHPEPRHENRIQFPCVDSKSKWSEQAKYLSSMPPEFLERIRAVQPAFSGAESAALQALVRISNRDKHRGQIQAAASVGALALPLQPDPSRAAFVESTGNAEFKFLGTDALEDGKPLMSVTVDRPLLPPERSIPVMVKYLVDDGVNKYDLAELLQALLSLHSIMTFVTSGLWPAAMPTTSAE